MGWCTCHHTASKRYHKDLDWGLTDSWAGAVTHCTRTKTLASWVAQNRPTLSEPQFPSLQKERMSRGADVLRPLPAQANSDSWNETRLRANC